MSKLSVGLATRNEEENIGRCLESIKNIAQEGVEIRLPDGDVKLANGIKLSTNKALDAAQEFGELVFAAL